ncbi:MAG: DNA polymerase III subunit chi [Gammaproteobacteria bacterium]
MRVDYYLLKSESLNASQSFLIRFIEKIYHKQHPIQIQFESEEDCTTWNDLLWTYDAASFLPHDQIAPTILKIECPYLTQSWVGLNLSLKPWLVNLPSRIIEIVFNNSTHREQQRLNYKSYQNQKFDIMIHNLTI